MKQVIQSYRTGELELIEAPAPAPRPDAVLVRTAVSLVSVGTERYMLDLAKKSLLGKAIARPDLVRQVVNKVRTEGPAEAWRQAMGRLDDPVPLGYSSAGVVISAGERADGFAAGDRVACSGAGAASHAEIVSIPRNLLVKIPDGVGFEEAAFVTLGGIAMHGVRMAKPELGESVLVLGLGLIGQLAVQILKAAGCRVLGADPVPAKVRMALDHGAEAGVVTGQEDLAAAARSFSGGVGVDAVLIFAATESNEPVEQAATAARVRARIVVPGLVGLDIPRKSFFEKELSFVVTRAWGPGLYDENYEKKGLDYPVPFVRWTAERNLAQFLDMIAAGSVRVSHLVTHRFPIERAVETYEMILAGREPFIGVLLTYPENGEAGRTLRLAPAGSDTPIVRESGNAARRGPMPSTGVGLVGAGLFAKGTLLPAMKGIAGLELRGVATTSGVSGHHIARRHQLAFCTTSVDELIGSGEIDLVMILTRHGSHAGLASRALEAGKDVFVEKPLALNESQLAGLEETHRRRGGRLMVGFNRRFAPATVRALRLLEGIREPLTVTIRVNAGYVPPDSWVHDPEDGGGRIVGEVCHFVDLAQALTRSLPVSVHAETIASSGTGMVETDNVALTLRMANGSLAVILYTAGGDKGFSRERVEVFGGGAVCVIDNFRTMEWSQNGRRRRLGNPLTGVDRGYRGEMKALAECLREGRPFPVPFAEYAATTRATFAALQSLGEGRPVEIPSAEPRPDRDGPGTVRDRL